MPRKRGKVQPKKIKTPPSESIEVSGEEESSSMESIHMGGGGSYCSCKMLLSILTILLVVYINLPKKKDPNAIYYTNAIKQGDSMSLKVYLGRSLLQETLIWHVPDFSYADPSSFSQLRKTVTLSKSQIELAEVLMVQLCTHNFEIKVILKDHEYTTDRPVKLQGYSQHVDLMMDKREGRKSIGMIRDSLEQSITKNYRKDSEEEIFDYGLSERSIRKYIYLQLAFPPEDRVHEFPTSTSVLDGHFKPPLDTSSWWSLERDAIPLHSLEEEDQVEIDLVFSTVYFKDLLWQVSFTQALRQDHTLVDIEDIKEIGTDNSQAYIYFFLGINALHVLFSSLACYHDLSFWRSRKSHHGLSLKEVYISFWVDIISMLYYVEMEIPSLYLVFKFFDLAMSLYKIISVTKIGFCWSPPFIYLRNEESYQSETAEIESRSITLLCKILFPVLAVYTCYKIYYIDARIGVWRFTISTLMNFAVLFGFIQMTPQLFINHHFKTVEFMNWNTMIYKFLNTIIDDLFAFMVRMPTLARLGMFRDDVVFVIYLYQRWIYRVDANRTETGFKEETEAQKIKNKQQSGPTGSKELAGSFSYLRLMKRKNRSTSKNSFKRKITPAHFQSKYEKDYFESVEAGDSVYDPNSVISRYLLLEDANENLQRLKSRFGDERNAHHLKSIHQSMMYKKEPKRPALHPDYNFIKKGQQYSTQETINSREANSRIARKLDRHSKNRNEFLSSQISTLPGPNITIREDTRTQPRNYPMPTGLTETDTTSYLSQSETSSMFGGDQVPRFNKERAPRNMPRDQEGRGCQQSGSRSSYKQSGVQEQVGLPKGWLTRKEKT